MIDAVAELSALAGKGSVGLGLLLPTDTHDALSAAGALPIYATIEQAIEAACLGHVFNATDIMAIFSGFFRSVGYLEEESGLIRVENEPSQAYVCCVSTVHADGLDECFLRLSVLTALWQHADARVAKRVAVCTNRCRHQALSIHAAIEAIDPIEREEAFGVPFVLQGEVSVAAPSEPLGWIDHEELWSTAGGDEELALAIALRAVRYADGDVGLAEIVASFVLGASFAKSLNDCGAAIGRSGVILEKCARVVAGCGRSDARWFRTGSGSDEPQRVREDGAKAWRVHVTEAHEALRLMYWVRCDDSVELANVGVKRELVIR